jgi:hypothetical protein
MGLNLVQLTAPTGTLRPLEYMTKQLTNMLCDKSMYMSLPEPVLALGCGSRGLGMSALL